LAQHVGNLIRRGNVKVVIRREHRFGLLGLNDLLSP
jgi:hypothetical protein